jgi:hypothetical protein
MGLTVGGAKGKRKFLEVNDIARHDGLWAVDLRDTPFCREVVQELDCIEDHKCQNDFWDCLERKGVSNRPNPLLNYMNTMLNERLVFVCARQVEPRRSHQQICELVKRGKFPISCDKGHMETLL